MLRKLRMGRNDDGEIVYLKERYFPTFILGATGMGKTSFKLNCYMQDEFGGFAKVAVGMPARQCFAISRGAKYCGLYNPISLNPMDSGYDENQISDSITESVNQTIKSTESGAAFSHVMRDVLDEAIRYCLRKNRKSLIHVKDYLATRTGNTTTREAVIHRLNLLLNDERMIPIFCGPNPVRWGELIRKRQTFIFDGYGMGADKMVMAGNLICQGIKNYFRYETPNTYWPVSLFIDEVQNFLNPNLFDILKEGRKYRISSFLASQDLALFDEKMTRVVLNSPNLISFRVAYKEAQLLAREIGYPKEGKDSERIDLLQNLEKFHFIYKTTGSNGKVETGMAKAPLPPLVLPMMPKKVEPKRTPGKGWFKLEPIEN